MLARSRGLQWNAAAAAAAATTTTTSVPRAMHALAKNQRRGFASGFGASLARPPPFGFAIVPQQRAYVVERFGKFHKLLTPGLHFMVPFIDRVAYVHSLKEEALQIEKASAITRDNVTLGIDGILYVRVFDPERASYGVENPIFAMSQLAQTTMRSELGKMTLDRTFEERENLNLKIVTAINQAAKPWGIEALRYEIRDIQAPTAVRAAMDLQAEAERRKRASVLQSEGERQSEMNRAEGEKAAIIARSEAEAESILIVAQATASGIKLVSDAVSSKGGYQATSLRVAEKYIEAFAGIAQKGNTIIIPSGVNDVSGMVAQALAVYGKVSQSASSQQQDRDYDSSASNDQINTNKVPSVRDWMGDDTKR